MSGVIPRNNEVLQNVGKSLGAAGQAIINEAGGELYNAAGRTGKGLLITWWVLIVAIFIYMIVLAIIYYNEYTKFKEGENGTWEYCTVYKDNKTQCVPYTGLTDDEIITWNIHKTVMNGLLAFMSIFGIILFVFTGVGSQVKEGRDICGSNQLGWICFLDTIWFIVNMVWDIKNSQYTKVEATTDTFCSGPEKFCGMMETFCGSVSEGFSNVAKKLRKF